MLDNYLINSSDKIINALKKINLKENSLVKTILVKENDKIIGTITDGDIRRGILNGVEISGLVKNVLNPNFKFFINNVDFKKVIEYRNSNHKLIPILNDQRGLIDIIDLSKELTKLPLTAVMMAGGVGSRLGKLTKNTPKPMLIVKGKPILEHNIDKIIKYGVKEVVISVNYLKDQIIDYFGDGKNKGISISYIEETEPLGTIGSLSLLKNFTKNIILLINSDTLSDVNYEEFYIQHNLNNGLMTVLTTEYQASIPYATLETRKGKIVGFKEKPNLKFNINGVIYLLDRKVLPLIPKHTFFDSTDLMKILIKSQKLSYFNHNGLWMDLGKKEDFEKADFLIKNEK